MTKIIKLPPASGITGRFLTKQDHYRNYRIWRKSNGYKLWLKKQWAEQDAKCFYCHISLKGRRHNVDHVKPQSYWGATSNSNMVLTCTGCNKNKGSTLPDAATIEKARLVSRSKKGARRWAARMTTLEKLDEQILNNELSWLQYERPH